MNEMNVLPDELLARSLSENETVLTFEDAKVAIDFLEKKGFVLLCWEGWLRYSDGTYGHSSLHQGTAEIHRKIGEKIDDFTQRAREFFIQTASQSIEDFKKNPEKPDSELYFCLSFIHIN